jgi:hypothetical protein
VDQAHKTLQDVGSSVGTALLLVRLADSDKVMGKYQQIVALDSETAAGKAADKFAGEQPEPGDQTTYKHVTTVLSDATDLLSEVRIAIVRRDTSRYAGLERALKKTQAQLTKVEGQLRS